MKDTASLALIVPLDGSDLAEQAIPAAMAVARPEGHVRLLRVVEPPDAVFDEVLRRYLPMTDQDRERGERDAHDALAETAVRYHEAGEGRVRLEISVRTGDPAEEILKEAAETGADMIVMASHGRGALDRWRFGSVADRVARTSNSPVMIVRAHPDKQTAAPVRFERLLLLTDGSPLSEQAAPVAALLGRRLGLPVRVVRVIDPARIIARASYATAIPQDIVDQIQTDMRDEAQGTVDEIALRLRSEGIEAFGDVLSGPVTPTLLETAGPYDLVVLTSHGRGGIERWLLGSVAEKLVRLAAAPVVLVPARRQASE